MVEKDMMVEGCGSMEGEKEGLEELVGEGGCWNVVT
jgi:hypothetical protein